MGFMKKRIAVIGGGIFGVTIAIHLAKKYKVDLYEKNSDLLKAASGINQYRVHRGYHYPRSVSTIISCQKGERSFRKEYQEAILDNNEHYYCIAREHSFINGQEFMNICDNSNLEYQKTDLDLVNKNAVDLVVKVKETLINPQKLRWICSRRLRDSKVNVLLNTRARKEIFDQYDKVVICTYALSNELLDDYPSMIKDYQYEVCEKIVVKMPPRFKNKSIVILDGPFMCVDPYGDTGNFLWGNVVHSIHATNIGKLPQFDFLYNNLLDNGVIEKPPRSKFEDFVKSGSYYFPDFKDARYIGSMFTIRTVLPHKDKTDERPTLIRQLDEKVITVYSGKFVNCVEAALDLEKMIN